MIIYCIFRLRGVRILGPVHDGDVHKNVRAGPADILRVLFQPFRLRGHIRVDIRSNLVGSEGRLLRSLSAQSSAVTEDLQSHQILVLT